MKGISTTIVVVLGIDVDRDAIWHQAYVPYIAFKTDGATYLWTEQRSDGVAKRGRYPNVNIVRIQIVVTIYALGVSNNVERVVGVNKCMSISTF